MGCELLSIWLLLWISHSRTIFKILIWIVVNCFQFDYFCGYHTALSMRNTNITVLWIAFNLITFVDITQLFVAVHYRIKLWIAFNLITFVDITQRNRFVILKLNSCELLSIWLLLWISHSLKSRLDYYNNVVNCFQFDYFCGYHTAEKKWRLYPEALWIAFNLITFVDITQPCVLWRHNRDRCELLSIWLLLWISHSKWL